MAEPSDDENRMQDLLDDVRKTRGRVGGLREAVAALEYPGRTEVLVEMKGVHVGGSNCYSALLPAQLLADALRLQLDAGERLLDVQKAAIARAVAIIGETHG